MAALSGAIYGRMAALNGLRDESKELVADTVDQFIRFRRIADGQREYLQGVIEFYQTILTIKATIVAQIQNDKVQQLTKPATRRTRRSKRSPPGPPSSSHPHWSPGSTG